MKTILWISRFSRPSILYGFTGGILLILAGISVYSVPLILKYMFNVIVPRGDLYAILQLSGLLLSILAARAAVSVLGKYMSNRYAHETLGNIQREVYSRIIFFNADLFEKHHPGDLSARITSDIYLLRILLIETLLSFVKNVIVVLLGLGFIFVFHRLMATIVAVFLTFNYLLLKYINRDILLKSKEVRATIGEMTGKIMETMNSFLFIKVYLLESHFISKINKVIDKYIKNGLSLDLIRSVYSETNSLVMSVVLVFVIVLMSVGVVNNRFSIGDIVSLVFFIQLITSAYSGLSNYSISFAEAKAAWQRIANVLANERYQQTVHVSVNSAMNGKIEIQHLSFSYNGSGNGQILNDICQTINPGERIALVGESGAGKSTLVKLLLKLRNNYEGTISFDEIELLEISEENVRRCITFVPQEDFIFDDTIWMNIKIANNQADDKRIEEAISKACLTDLVHRYGRDYLVGWQGNKISGGEKQRIAIARAFLKDSPILIIDEAMSQLDSISERVIRDALKQLWNNKTTIVIAHRLSTVIQMDRIVVMKSGEILDEGDHHELFERCSYYRKLCETQYIDKEATKTSHDATDPFT